MPSLQADGAAFFPNVLKSHVFQKEGILYGDEAAPETADTEMKRQLQWAVIDPRKHILYIWEKDQPEFPDSAITLGASCFTNGPFCLYTGQKTGFWARVSYYWDRIKLHWGLGVLEILKTILSPWLDGIDSDALRRDAERNILIQNYGDSTPEGYIFGDRYHIHRTDMSRPTYHYFGRKAGRAFADYSIGKGASPIIAEVIGGLYRTVMGYADALDDPRTNAWGTRITHQQHDFGYWGLAPLSISDPALLPYDIQGAFESLSTYDDINFPTLPVMTGVLIVAFYGGDTSVMASKLIAARVMDAVRIDGSDSVLFGHDKEILVGAGDDMSIYKKLYNKWGYMTLRV